MGNTFFNGNPDINDTTNFVKVKDGFMQEVLTTWAEANFEDRITCVNHFLGQSLWSRNNSLIRISNCPVFNSDWNRKGIVKVRHLKDDHNNFLSLIMPKNRNRSIVGYSRYSTIYGNHASTSLLCVNMVRIAFRLK